MSTLYKYLFKKTILNHKGQALIEFVISNILLISLVTLGFLLMYISFLKYFNHVNIYNSTICVAKNRPILICKYNLRKNIKSTMFFGSINKLILTKKYKTITASIKWSLNKWQFQKKIVLNMSSLSKNLPIIEK
ncbi:MAG: hypothetical protein HAW60_01970 [Bdellovibrionales bacterium]|nr:hypothetical protein [Bdellovibrionales bacterium]